jgi:peptidoglycan/xylan/chitin deacetylase (PgdA/CDA1 family)
MVTIHLQAWTWPSLEGGGPGPGSPVETVTVPARQLGGYRPVVGPLDPLVRDLDGPPDVLEKAGTGLPSGPARAEAIAARLRRDGVAMAWGDSGQPKKLGELDAIYYRHGRSSVLMTRADPDVLPYMQLGSWFNASWRVRLIRRVLVGSGAATLRRLLPRHGLGLRLRADLAFWAGARDQATRLEWRRLTASSYVVLTYHRLAGERRPGQEQLDITPRRFASHVRFLARFGYRPLSVDDVVRFSSDPTAVLPRRSYLATFDDAYRDNGEPLRRHAQAGPVLFAPTAAIGGTAGWTEGEPLLSWDELRALEDAGVVIGSHCRTHPRLTDLATEDAADELRGSRDELAAHLARPAAAIAYPHGAHDVTVVREVRDAGFAIGFTTTPGRNGAGTHPLCLRRVGIWAQDGRLRLAWKLVTGDYAPGQPRTAGLGWLTLARRASRPDPSTVGRGVA